MPLIINGIEFKGELTKNVVNAMLTAIMQLPAPKIIPDFQVKIPDDELGLCLQRESIYVDEFNPKNKIRYLGSVEVYDCLFVYLRSETDHLAYHVDKSHIDFISQLARFNDKNDIQVTILGGWPDCDRSNQNLKMIVMALFNAAQELNIKITIIQQKVNKNNAFDDSAKLEYVYNFILENANILNVRKYHKSFAIQKCMSEWKISDLQKPRHIDLDAEQLRLFCLTVMGASIVALDNDAENSLFYAATLGNNQLTEAEFYYLITQMYCKQSYQCIHDLLLLNNNFGPGRLTNMAMDLSTGNVIVISPNMKTPLRQFREAILGDKNADHYRDSYDPVDGNYFEPNLSSDTYKLSERLWSDVKLDSLTKEKIPAKLEGSASVVKNKANTCALLLFSLAEAVRQPVQAQTLLPVLDAGQYQEYSGEQSVMPLLNQLTGKIFVAKFRQYPQYTLDAHYYSREKREVITTMIELRARGVQAHIFRYKNGYCLCVPAINVQKHAESIQVAVDGSYQVKRARLSGNR